MTPDDWLSTHELIECQIGKARITLEACQRRQAHFPKLNADILWDGSGRGSTDRRFLLCLGCRHYILPKSVKEELKKNAAIMAGTAQKARLGRSKTNGKKGHVDVVRDIMARLVEDDDEW